MAWDPGALVGTRLGSCVLEAPLGVGGMGAVYLARQDRPHRQVAVKVLRPQLASDPKAWQIFLARFRREADVTATLDHANIVPIYEFGEEAGKAFLVMPYLADGSLATLVAREGSLPVLRVIEYIEQAAAALDHAHSRGLVHRDVKPSNLLLHPDGRVLLTDFGIARPFAGNPLAAPLAEQGAPAAYGASAFEDVALTQSGAAMGTPEYMAPEQVQGEPVSPATDTYALGIVTYVLLTGRSPFGGGELNDVLRRQLLEPPQPLRFLRPDVPSRTEEVIFWALAKEPADRPPSAGAFARALRESRRSRTLGQLWGWSSAEEDASQLALSAEPRGFSASSRAPFQTPPAAPGASRANGSSTGGSGLYAAARPATGAEPAARAAHAASSSSSPSLSPSPALPPFASNDDATLFDATPSWRRNVPVWPMPAGTGSRSFGRLPRTALVAAAVLVIGAIVFGVGITLGTALYSGSPLSGGAPGAHVTLTPSPTATRLPSPTATVLARGLAVSPTSITLSCRGKRTVTLTNNGSDNLQWKATIPTSFGFPEVSVSPSSGELESHHHTSITITNRSTLSSQQGSVSFGPEDSDGGPPAVVQFTASSCV